MKSNSERVRGNGILTWARSCRRSSWCSLGQDRNRRSSRSPRGMCHSRRAASNLKPSSSLCILEISCLRSSVEPLSGISRMPPPLCYLTGGDTGSFNLLNYYSPNVIANVTCFKTFCTFFCIKLEDSSGNR